MANNDHLDNIGSLYFMPTRPITMALPHFAALVQAQLAQGAVQLVSHEGCAIIPPAARPPSSDRVPLSPRSLSLLCFVCKRGDLGSPRRWGAGAFSVGPTMRLVWSLGGRGLPGGRAGGGSMIWALANAPIFPSPCPPISPPAPLQPSPNSPGGWGVSHPGLTLAFPRSPMLPGHLFHESQ